MLTVSLRDFLRTDHNICGFDNQAEQRLECLAIGTQSEQRSSTKTLTMWRTQYGERILEGDETLKKQIPKSTCTDLKEWDIELQILSDAVLWDVDYEDAQLYIDFSPEKSKELRDWMDIPDDYFMAIADDLTDEQAQAAIKELQKLCDSIIR